MDDEGSVADQLSCSVAEEDSEKLGLLVELTRGLGDVVGLANSLLPSSVTDEEIIRRADVWIFPVDKRAAVVRVLSLTLLLTMAPEGERFKLVETWLNRLWMLEEVERLGRVVAVRDADDGDSTLKLSKAEDSEYNDGRWEAAGLVD